MKVKSLTVRNIGIVENETVAFEKPLNLFFGEIKSGKTTLAINSIKLLFGGQYSRDLLRHGTNSGYVEIKFDNATISRKFYKNKNGDIKSYPIEFYKDNQKIPKPVDKIKEIINPFLLDQDFLTKKTIIEKERYFIELFNIDTSEIDVNLKAKLDDSKELRSNIKSYGEIEITPIEKPDLLLLGKEREVITSKNLDITKKYLDEKSTESQRVLNHNRDVETHNRNIETKTESIDNNIEKLRKISQQKNELEQEGKKLCNSIDENRKWIDDIENAKKETIEPEKIEEPEYESTEEIDENISNAKVNELKYTQYQQNITKQEEKEYHENLLSENESLVASLRAMKRNELSKIADNTGIKDFTFDDIGNIRYQDTTIDMLSTSQMMQLSSECAGLYPSDIGLELIDKAESLGKSIYEYIDKATNNKSTIIATIVSDKPAENIPKDVGVFVVEDGKIVSA